MKQTKEYEMDYVEERWNAGRITPTFPFEVIELGEATKAWVIHDQADFLTEIHMLCVLPERLQLDWGLSAIDMCLSIYVGHAADWNDHFLLDEQTSVDDEGNLLWLDMPAATRIGEYVEFNDVLYIMHSLDTMGTPTGGC